MEQENVITKKLRALRGKVIEDSIEIEESLAYRIQDYFFKKNCREKTLFYWLILNTRRFGFNDKIELFEAIPYFQDRKYFKTVTESLRHILGLRNQLAHWDLDVSMSQPNRLVLRDPLVKKDDLVISDDTVREFKRHVRVLKKFFSQPSPRL